MASTVFFSWQSDARLDLNKEFIQTALVEAATGMDVLPAERLEVDEGMNDVAGSPEVARVLFEKIDAAFLFVGDVSLVGQIPRGGLLLPKDAVVKEADTKRRVPNPNVAIELGYADGVLRPERVLRVMNTAFGKPEDQPFDVRNRRFPISYRLTPDMKADEKNAVMVKLVAVLKGAIDTASSFQLKGAPGATLTSPLDWWPFQQPIMSRLRRPRGTRPGAYGDAYVLTNSSRGYSRRRLLLLAPVLRTTTKSSAQVHLSLCITPTCYPELPFH